MEQNNKYISVSYALYDTTEGKSELVEQTTDEQKFIFISGMGVTLPAFENAIAGLAQGEQFDFTLTPEEAYGERFEERIIELDKGVFCINGQFDAQHVQVGAIIPLQNEDGNRFNGVVLAITDQKVKIDLNHPLAGKTLNFKGVIEESREATAEEISKMAQMLSGEGGCGGCNGSCGEGGCNNGSCGEGGCGNCH